MINRSLGDLFAEFLALLGHASDLAANGHEALARFDPLIHQAVLTGRSHPLVLESSLWHLADAHAATADAL
jgi:hypothetical protein